jgi:hypothetical protein
MRELGSDSAQELRLYSEARRAGSFIIIDIVDRNDKLPAFPPFLVWDEDRISPQPFPRLSRFLL